MKAILHLIAALVLSSTTLLAGPPPNSGYQLRFEEKFQGNKLNEDLWSYREDTRQLKDYIVNALDVPEAVSVSNNALHIRCYQVTNSDGSVWNAGGGIISKPQFGYGYYECLSKPWMGARGVHSAFWQRGGPNGTVFEIDSSEIDSSWYGASKNLYFLPGAKGYNTVTELGSGASFTNNQDGTFLHEYEITPEGVIYWQNGKVVQTAYHPELNAAQQVWLTALNGVNTHGNTPEKQPCETTFQYFRYYAKDYPGLNLLPNGNFEMNQDTISPTKPLCWSHSALPLESGIVVRGDASLQDYVLRHASIGGGYRVNTAQTLEYINNGSYELTAKTRSSGGQQVSRIVVSAYGGPDLVAEIPESFEWTNVVIAKIPVSSNGITVSIESEGAEGQWMEIDDVRFQLPTSPGQKQIENPFLGTPDPAWRQAVIQPFVFKGSSSKTPDSIAEASGDAKFGTGDAVTVSFCMKASQLFQGDLISKMSSEGPGVGWSVYMGKDGSMQFRIGNEKSFKTLNNAAVRYTPNNPVVVTCTFEKGSADFYVNGTHAAGVKGLPDSITDNESPVRVGGYQVFAAVSDVRVYNRALQADEVAQVAKETVKPK